jgi:hypothetical protein
MYSQSWSDEILRIARLRMDRGLAALYLLSRVVLLAERHKLRSSVNFINFLKTSIRLLINFACFPRAVLVN